MSQEASPGKLILVPAVITFGVTLLRLIGELQAWSPALFNREAGGGGAIVGISWLVPIFGAWFGWKLAKAGGSPGRIGPALLIAILAFALMPGIGFGAIKAASLNPQSSPPSGCSWCSRSRGWRSACAPGRRSARCCSSTRSPRACR